MLRRFLGSVASGLAEGLGGDEEHPFERQSRMDDVSHRRISMDDVSQRRAGFSRAFPYLLSDGGGGGLSHFQQSGLDFAIGDALERERKRREEVEKETADRLRESLDALRRQQEEARQQRDREDNQRRQLEREQLEEDRKQREKAEAARREDEEQRKKAREQEESEMQKRVRMPLNTASNKKGQVFRARQWLSTQDVRSIFHRLQTANKSNKNNEKGRGRGRPKMTVPPCEGDEDEDCEGEVDASEDVYNMLDSVNGYGSDDDSDDDDQAGPSTSGH